MGRFQWLEFETPSGTNNLADEEYGAPIPTAQSIFAEAELSFFQGHYEVALRDYSRATGEDRTYLYAWIRQIQCQIAMGEVARAKVWAEKVKGVFPKSAQALSTYGYVLCAGGAVEEGYNSCLAAMRMNATHNNPEILLDYAYCLIKAEKLQEATTTIEALQSLVGDNSLWKQRIGQMLLDSGQVNSAYDVLNMLAKKGKTSPWNLYLLAECHYRLGKKGVARRLLKRCLAMEPGLVQARDLYLTLPTDDQRDEMRSSVASGILGVLWDWMSDR